MGVLMWQLIAQDNPRGVAALVASGVIQDQEEDYRAFAAAMEYHARLVHHGSWPLSDAPQLAYELRFSRDDSTELHQ